MGSKQNMIETILQMIPLHNIFVEALCGAASLALNKPSAKVEVINDLNKDIYDFFITIRDNYDKLYHYLLNTPYHRGLYYELKHKWRQGWRPMDQIEKVATWFFLQDSSFSGTFGAGFSTARKDKNVASEFASRVDLLYKVRDRLRNIYIDCRDYQEVIEYYDCKDMFTYLDPPYWIDAANNYYKAGQNFDHYRLAEVLNRITGKAIISYYPHPELVKIYPPPKWNFKSIKTVKHSFKADSNAQGEERYKPEAEELLICNFEPLPLFANIN